MGEIHIAGESGDTVVLVAPESPFVVETGAEDEVLLPSEEKDRSAKQ